MAASVRNTAIKRIQGVRGQGVDGAAANPR